MVVFGTIAVVVIAVVSAAAAAQLPPGIQMDRHVLVARMAVEAGEWEKAGVALDVVLELAEEHELANPDDYLLIRAQERFGSKDYVSAGFHAELFLEKVESPRTNTRLWVRTASVETQASSKRGKFP